MKTYKTADATPL